MSGTGQSTATDQFSGCQAWGVGREEHMACSRYRAFFGVIKIFWNQLEVMVATVSVPNAIDLYVLKWL